MPMFDRIKAWFGSGSSNGAGDESGAPMISCEDALQLVHEFLDGELEDSSAEEVKAHFDVCQRCYPHLQLEAAFRDAVKRAAAGQTAPPELRDKVTALLAEARADG